MQVVADGIEHRDVPAGNLVAFVLINAFRAGVPGDDLAVRIQEEERIVLHPAWNGTLGGGFVRFRLRLVTKDQNVTNRQHIALRGILDLPRSSVRTQQLERAYLLAVR